MLAGYNVGLLVRPDKLFGSKPVGTGADQL